MSLLDVLKEKAKDPEAARVCVVCGRECTNACGLCFRDQMEEAVFQANAKGEQPVRPMPVGLCSVKDRDCSNKHVRERHAAGLVGENDPQWRGKV